MRKLTYIYCIQIKKKLLKIPQTRNSKIYHRPDDRCHSWNKEMCADSPCPPHPPGEQSTNSPAHHCLVSGTDQTFKSFAKLMGVKLHISLIIPQLLETLSIFVRGYWRQKF